MIEWPYVGAQQAHSKYSAADDITAANVGELEIAWQWEPNERPLEEYGTRPGAFQATPIMVNNVLYLSTMYTRVAALDAETGSKLWRGATPRWSHSHEPSSKVRAVRRLQRQRIAPLLERPGHEGVSLMEARSAPPVGGGRGKR